MTTTYDLFINNERVCAPDQDRFAAINPFTREEWAKLRAETVDAMPQVIERLGRPKALLGYQARTVALAESTAISATPVASEARFSFALVFARVAPVFLPLVFEAKE